MASNLEKFQKNIIGSKGGIVDYTALISSKGDFSRVEDIQVILNSWNNILQTPTRSYNNNPEYGSDLYKFVFDPADEFTADSIKDEIRYRLMRFDDRARITNIDVIYQNDGKGFILNIDLNYRNEDGRLTTSINAESVFNLT